MKDFYSSICRSFILSYDKHCNINDNGIYESIAVASVKQHTKKKQKKYLHYKNWRKNSRDKILQCKMREPNKSILFILFIFFFFLELPRSPLHRKTEKWTRRRDRRRKQCCLLEIRCTVILFAFVESTWHGWVSFFSLVWHLFYSTLFDMYLL